MSLFERHLSINGYKPTGRSLTSMSKKLLKKLAVELNVNYEDLTLLKDKNKKCQVYKK